MNLLEFMSEEDRQNYENLQKKYCKYCKTNKPLSEFPIRKDNHGGHDHRCYECKKKRDKIVKKLETPYKVNFCEICGAVPDAETSKEKGHRHQGICKDHDPDTNEFRGWLCHLCNRSLGGLGDTIESLQKALDYLTNIKIRHKERIKHNELFHSAGE